MFNKELTKEEFNSKLQELEDKYCKLVWYARKAPSDSTEYWAGVPDDIKTGALNSASKVEEFFPEETDALKSEEGDWQHGFNSGCLAAFRFISTSLDTSLHEDDETGEMVCFGGIDQAEEEFPFLDT